MSRISPSKHGGPDGADKMLLDLAFVIIGVLLVVLLVLMTQVNEMQQLPPSAILERSERGKADVDTFIVFSDGQRYLDLEGKSVSPDDIKDRISSETARIAVLLLSDTTVQEATDLADQIRSFVPIPVVVSAAPQSWVAHFSNRTPETSDSSR